MKLFKSYFFIALLFGLSNIYAQTGGIRINQLGYYPSANKFAVVVFTDASTFEVINTADSSVEYSGNLGPKIYWSNAGDSVKLCDFSTLTKTGTYQIRIQGFGESYPFEISNTVMRKPAYASLKSFYYQRASYELTHDYAGLWARAAGHPDTNCQMHTSSGKTGSMSSPGGWYDAGDFGKYVVNAGISVATLLSFYENFGDFFEDSILSIPESGNGINDLLDEVKYELDWLKTMQDEDGGVFVKLTTLNFTGFIMPAAATGVRYVIGKSTASTLDFAAMMAMAGRIYKDYDTDYAADCILRAKNAWSWAKSNPAIYFKNPSDVSTGEYGDGNVTDEFIWAAAELFISTDEAEYKTYLESKSTALRYLSAPGWPNVQPLASLSLATQENGLSESLKTTIKNSIITTSDNWLSQINVSPCRIPNFSFNWGSNSGIANNGVGLLYAYLLTKDIKYIKGAAECADYILGKNATGFSFVSSYGYKTPMNFHHRASGADGIIQPVPGFVAGGPNGGKQDNSFYPFDAPAKCYVDVEGSYASNEVCINWNSPLTALLAGIDAVMGDSSDVDFDVQTSANNPPVIKITSPTNGSTAGSASPVIVKGTATDSDGISKVELYLNAHFIGEITSGSFEWALDSLSFGTHSVSILAYDSYGLTTEQTNLFSYYQVFKIPGKIEAEEFSAMTGIETQVTSDSLGGLNLTSLDAGDRFEYTVSVKESGSYRLSFRVASSTGGGKFEIRKPTQAVLSANTVDATGGLQSWTTISNIIVLAEGTQILRFYVLSGGWNFNWMEFEKVDVTSILDNESTKTNSIMILPNPINGNFKLKYSLCDLSPVEFSIYDMQGRLIEKKEIVNNQTEEGYLDWNINEKLDPGVYSLFMGQNGVKVGYVKLIKAQ
ncbi:MAG: glycoside hydrolase family 9 protein [Bacteroidales bacterium]|nr:glycoside hydrolase family 9 protein [Bacteroidales bacterium]MCF8389413.1 glycoside hydrolase family 9 protein [Bacteroidales bacterium]